MRAIRSEGQICELNNETMSSLQKIGVYSAVNNGGYMLLELVISGILIYLLMQRNMLNLSV